MFLTTFLHHSITSTSHKLGDIKNIKILGVLDKKKLGEEEEAKRSLLQVLVTARSGPLSSLSIPLSPFTFIYFLSCQS
jgi:hypothetical protein